MTRLFILIVILLGSIMSYAQVQIITIQTSAQCEMCKHSIEKKVRGIKGVKSAALDIQTKSLKVKYDTKKVDEKRIKMAISQIGYDADEVKADEKAYAQLKECCKKK